MMKNLLTKDEGPYFHIDHDSFRCMSIEKKCAFFRMIPMLSVNLFEADIVWVGLQIIRELQAKTESDRSEDLYDKTFYQLKKHLGAHPMATEADLIYITRRKEPIVRWLVETVLKLARK